MVEFPDVYPAASPHIYQFRKYGHDGIYSVLVGIIKPSPLIDSKVAQFHETLAVI